MAKGNKVSAAGKTSASKQTSKRLPFPPTEEELQTDRVETMKIIKQSESSIDENADLEPGGRKFLGQSERIVQQRIAGGFIIEEPVDENTPLSSYSPKGRTLRKAFQRPRPDLPANAPANRSKKQIALTLPQDLVETLNTHVKARGTDRNAFIEHAIRKALTPK